MPKTDKSETLEPATEPVVEAVVPPEAETPEEEQFDEARAKALIAKLREGERQARKDAKRLAELEVDVQKRADAEKTELQKAQERAMKLEAEKKALEIQVLRRDIAAKVKLPEALIDRLKGETPEDLEADATALLASLNAVKVAPPLNPTNPGAPQTGETDADRRKRLGL